MSDKQLANARVSILSANSTRKALVVHTVDESGAFVSPGAGSTAVSITDIRSTGGSSNVTVMDSTNNSIGVTIRAGSAAGTEYTDGDVDATVSGQAVFFDNSSNTLRPVTIARGLPVNLVAGQSTIVTVSTGSVRVHQSSAADMNVTVAGYVAPSTTVQVSSLAGAVITRSSAANMLMTAYQSSAADLNVTVAGLSTAVRCGQSTYTDLQTLSGVRDRDFSTQVAAVHNDIALSSAYGLVTRWPRPYWDSTNTAARVSIVAGSAAGTEYTEGDVDATPSGQVVFFDNSSNTMRSVTITRGLPVNLIAGQSTTVNVSSLAGAVITRSSAADSLHTVYQSSATDLNVTVAGYSTTVNVSSLAGAVSARINTSSGGAVEGSTTTPAGGILGLHTRQVFPTLLSTTVLITSTNSTAIYPLISSAASPLRHKVYAYFVQSTHTNPSTAIFCSSASDAGFNHWSVGFGSGSSGMTGANLALTPPGFIFAGVANTAMNIKLEGGSSAASTVIARVAVAYFTEA